MKLIKWAIGLSVLLTSTLAFAQVASGDLDFFNQVFAFIQSWGGLAEMAKISGIVLLIIASVKVSFVKPLWDKLGSAKAFVAPILGLIAGLLSNGPITFASVMAYVSAGAGAIILHELLDAIKAIPGLGAMYVSIINFIESLPFFGSGGSQPK